MEIIKYIQKKKKLYYILFCFFISSCQGESYSNKSDDLITKEPSKVESIDDIEEENNNVPFFAYDSSGIDFSKLEMFNSKYRDGGELCAFYKHTFDVENDAVGRSIIVRGFYKLNQQNRNFEEIGESRVYCKKIPIGANAFSMGLEADDTKGLKSYVYLEIGSVHIDQLPEYSGEIQSYLVVEKSELFPEPDWLIFSASVDENSLDLEDDDFNSTCFYRDPSNLLKIEENDFTLADWVSSENNGDKFYISCQFLSRGRIGPVFDVEEYILELL